MTQEELIAKQLLKAIQASIDKFNAATPGIQNRIADKLELLLKDLEVRNGNIAQSTSNIKAIGKIKSELEAIIFDDGYKKNVADFIKSFDEVTKLQNEYFSAVSNKYKPNNLLKEIRNQSVNSALEYLTEAGINANVTQKLQDILRQNITSGAKFSNANDQLRNFIKTNDKGLGALERYTKQITNDTLNQYAASYSDVVTSDLGLEWFEYTGALIATSRCFCDALIKKKYIHVSELANIVKGNFEEFKDADCTLNTKYELPEGMIPNTNAHNFKIYRGGYNCNHQLIAVSEVAVPRNIREAVYRKMFIPFDKNGFKKAA